MLRSRIVTAAFTFTLLIATACGADEGADVRNVSESRDTGSEVASGSMAGEGTGPAAEEGAEETVPDEESAASEAVEVGEHCESNSDPTVAAAGVMVSLNAGTVTVEGPVPAGYVEFAIENQGTEGHELLIVKGFDPELLPTDADAGGSVDEAALEAGSIILESGEIASLETCLKLITLAPGDYIALCNRVVGEGEEMETHFAQGEFVTFTVA